MRRLWIALSISTAACGPAPGLVPCGDGIALLVLDEATAPPANVAAKLRITDCDGQPLSPRLEASEIELSEDGELVSSLEALRTVEPVKRETGELVLVALDLSGSVTRSGLKEQMIEGARALIDTLDPEDEIALFGFDGRPDLVPFEFFTTDRVALDVALDRASFAATVDDSTNLNGAVVGALELLDQAVRTTEDEKTVAHGSLIVFTDGSDRAGRVSQGEVQDAIEGSRHAIYAIGVGGERNEEMLQDLGRDGRALAADPSELKTAFTQVAEQMAARAETDYLVSYCSPARAGQRELQIHVKRGELEGEATISFRADGFGAGCTPVASPLR